MSSVTLVHPTQGVEAFGNISYRCVRWPSSNRHAKCYGDRPRGSPLSVWNAKVVSPLSIPVFAAFHKALFLAPFFFIMYTTPLSSLISSLSLNHHLYADDTQLFFSFHPPDVHCSVAHLHGALQQISSCMTSNLLSRLGFKTCLSKTKTKTQQFQDKDQDQDFDIQDQDRDRDSRLTRPILEIHDWDELWQTKSHGKQKIHHTSSCTQ